MLHADRDTDCIALYAKDSIDWSEKMSELPTVARSQRLLDFLSGADYDPSMERALYEACDNWDGECPEELRVLVPVQEMESVDDAERGGRVVSSRRTRQSRC